MKKIFKPIMAVTAICTMFNLSSCTKKADSNDGAKFAGTWVGTSTCNPGVSDTLVLSTTSDVNVLTTPGTVGVTGCVKNVLLKYNASGNNLTINTQTFTDNCGLSYTLNGVGSLSGSVLTISETASGAVNATCVATMHKL